MSKGTNQSTKRKRHPQQEADVKQGHSRADEASGVDAKAAEQDSNPKDFFSNLPNETVATSASFLDHIDLGSLSQVSKFAQIAVQAAKQSPDSSFTLQIPRGTSAIDEILKIISSYSLESGEKEAAQQSHSIKSLDLSEVSDIITDEALSQILPMLPKLQSLDLNGCTQITNAGLDHLTRLTSLKSLILAFCHQITDAGLEAVAENLKSLTSLNLAFCNQITDAGLQAVAKNLPSLTSLNLLGCDRINNAGLRDIAQHLTSLTSLNLAFCRQITDEGLIAVAENLTSLTSLGLTDCRQISDAGVAAVATHLHSLTSLNLYNCYRITDVGLQAIAQRLPSLASLDLRGCTRIDEKIQANPMDHINSLRAEAQKKAAEDKESGSNDESYDNELAAAKKLSLLPSLPTDADNKGKAAEAVSFSQAAPATSATATPSPNNAPSNPEAQQAAKENAAGKSV